MNQYIKNYYITIDQVLTTSFLCYFNFNHTVLPILLNRQFLSSNFQKFIIITLKNE